ncbi:MAG TPA: PepSY domain-containing protein [Candidatus Copromonas avistercoris]|nr:PepSY domain-containing protein [Candidatus Copromonas avistercoris]
MNIRKKTGAAVLGVLCMAALAGCQNQQSQTAQTAEYIGIEAAKETALKSAGLTEDQADFSTAGLDSRDGTFFYQVNFEAEGMEYDYAIDAVTGVVIEENSVAADDGAEATGAAASEAETSGAAADDGAEAVGAAASKDAAGDAASGAVQASGAAQASEAAQTSAAAQNASDSGMIGEEKAKEIALNHAGLTEDQTQRLLVKRDYDDGRSIYEVEFYGEGRDEYDYEIDAATGEIVAFDTDLHDHGTAPSEGQSQVSEEQVRQTVLERVPGASVENIFLHLEWDDGRLEYEGELIYDNMEYEFKIDAYSGAVTEWEAEQFRR